MEQRQLGDTDLCLTTIGLGTWAIGGSWEFGWGPQDDAESLRAIERALDQGMNWLDTAAAYGLGHSEEVCGQALQGRRDAVIVATKGGLRWDDSGRSFRDSRPASLRQEVEDSLRRLQTDVIDLYQIHWPDPNTPLEESWAALAELVQQGKLRYLGVSNFSVEQIERCHAIYPVASLQPPYSLLRRAVEDELLPFCQQNGIGVLAYSPMESGLLTGRFDITRLASDDWRLREDRFRQPELARNLALVERLRPIAAARGQTVAQLAVAWVLRHPAVTAAIVGARTAAQADAIMRGADWRLSDDELAAVDEALAAAFGA